MRGEQKEYADLLGQQAAPYQSKAAQIQLKLDELWKNEKAQNQIYTDFHRASASLQSLLGPQIERLKVVVQGSSPVLLNLVYRKDQKQPTITPSLLKLAREQVRKSPMDKNLLKKLIHLEMDRGYQPMIIYLNSRLQKLDQNSERRSLWIKVCRILSFLLVVTWSAFALAIPIQDQKEKGTKEMKTKGASKEISFDEILVQGKYHFSDEVVVTVEQDKFLDGLLSVPKDFKDRIKRSAERN